ncbi:RNHCP domain-containing protein [Nocardiopsis sp. B62]|uniref:RNHCP domain-containing protein n=1 Tax=Nocardiopsis sp. B62 TaxID=2824874 RepID=UPI001B35CD50|nr:RNHCP domain-containing protein [Nocardiopsis sp. B62]MBQ1084642.1 RNHCP domain-containing protein [Nocardiopsis sp. B62]
MSHHDPDPRTTVSDHSARTVFGCVLCGLSVSLLGSDGTPRDHCPSCLTSLHVHDQVEGGVCDCEGRMTPISVVVARDGRWRLVHRCVRCDELSESAVAADDNPLVLMRIAVRPLAEPPFPLEMLGEV